MQRGSTDVQKYLLSLVLVDLIYVQTASYVFATALLHLNDIFGPASAYGD